MNAEQKFQSFHKDNPHVYDTLRDLAFHLKKRGRKTYSINGLFEVVRWHIAMQTTDEQFKLNNNFRSRYARLLMDNEPALRGFFRLRKLVTS